MYYPDWQRFITFEEYKELSLWEVFKGDEKMTCVCFTKNYYTKTKYQRLENIYNPEDHAN